METQASIWHRHCKLEGAKPGVLRGLKIFEDLGAPNSVGDCIAVSNGELLGMVLHRTPINSPCLARSTPPRDMADTSQTADN